MSAIITLTTDFGGADWFVGAMKGAILRVAPRATIVDVCHGVPAGDIQTGAFALRAAYRYFPRGTIHVAVVDPGVGSSRGGLAVQTADYCFVGPDNGVLSLALAEQRIQAVHRLENQRYFQHPVSRTFHGRDVFGPVAAHVSRGVRLRALGPEQGDFVRLPWPRPERQGDILHGVVVYVDRFGNGITNLSEGALQELGAEWWGLSCAVGRHRRLPCVSHYQAVATGEAAAVLGSTGLLEIAVNGGSAARQLGLRVGSRVRVWRGEAGGERFATGRLRVRSAGP
jgi:S-adenosylmethionine hydrolase